MVLITRGRKRFICSKILEGYVGVGVRQTGGRARRWLFTIYFFSVWFSNKEVCNGHTHTHTHTKHAHTFPGQWNKEKKKKKEKKVRQTKCNFVYQ